MRYTLRILGREKGFSAFVVLSLALGIAAVTTIFSVVDSVLLKALPYAEPQRLFTVSESLPRITQIPPRIPVNGAHFHTWRTQDRLCSELALLDPRSFNLTEGGEPERIGGVATTWELFRLLGVQAQLGRTFTADDETRDGGRVVVLADSLWRRRFDARSDVIGRSIRLDDELYTVIGVLPAEEAESEMALLLSDVAAKMHTDLEVRLTPLADEINGRSASALWFVMAAVGTVLLILCVNLGNLMWVRAGSRLQDAAIRRALGATRMQLLRPILAQSLLLSLAGCVGGVLLAYVGIDLVVRTAPVDIPRIGEIGFEPAAWFFALLVSVGCGVFCGLWPVWRSARAQPLDALRGSTLRTTEGGARLRARAWLVGLQVALSTTLLVTASLLGISFLRLIHVDRGYSGDRVLSTRLNLPRNRYPNDESRLLFDQRLLERLQTLPGVRSAALVSALPLTGEHWGDLINEDGDTRPPIERPSANFRFVSPRYFDAMGIRLVAGRGPSEADQSHRVAVVSENVARQVWPGEEPLGKRIKRTDDAEAAACEVIGVVEDVRAVRLDQQPPLMVYVPYWDGPYWQGGIQRGATYLMHTTGDPRSMVPAFRDAVRQIDPELPLGEVRTMQQVLDDSVGQRRFQMMLVWVFAASALLLACLGIYGVVSYTVSRRAREMGIRMALGAQSAGLSLLVVRQEMRPVVVGLAAGVLGALGVGRLIESLLFGVGAHDPVTVTAAVLFLAAVALVACWLPARRASRVDPAAARQQECVGGGLGPRQGHD
ncbi:MAG: ABC transporter permease, partial [Acidobacteriota bacterium]